MSECVESAPAAEANQVKDSKLEVEGENVHDTGDGLNKLDHASEKTVCGEICEDSKDETELDESQQAKRKTLEDRDREDEVTKKVRKDEDDEYGGDEEATSEKTDENDDGVEKDPEGTEDAADEIASEEPIS